MTIRQPDMLGLLCQRQAPHVFARRAVHRAIVKLISREVKEQEPRRLVVLIQEVQNGETVAELVVAG